MKTQIFENKNEYLISKSNHNEHFYKVEKIVNDNINLTNNLKMGFTEINTVVDSQTFNMLALTYKEPVNITDLETKSDLGIYFVKDNNVYPVLMITTSSMRAYEYSSRNNDIAIIKDLDDTLYCTSTKTCYSI